MLSVREKTNSTELHHGNGGINANSRKTLTSERVKFRVASSDRRCVVGVQRRSQMLAQRLPHPRASRRTSFVPQRRPLVALNRSSGVLLALWTHVAPMEALAAAVRSTTRRRAVARRCFTPVVRHIPASENAARLGVEESRCRFVLATVEFLLHAQWLK